ncbi:MAG: NitT/TauT family transport system substrate-binding protein [Solirubrobacteraceae bacterium]|nr:NitT/TauT family transport system substrate-binding protein [Solirubrobacteraceae bacterium]
MRMQGVLAALVVAAFALVACGGDDGGQAASEDGVTKLTVGVLPVANAAPLYLGMEKGFFRDEGLEIAPQMAQSGNELVTALVGNDSQFAFLGYVPVIVARSKGLPVKVVANADTGAETAEDEWQVIMSPKGSSIREPADLAGKTVAVNALKGVAEVGLKAALEKEGVDPDSIKLLEVPFPEMPAAMDAKRVDAIWAPEPFLTAVLAQGAQEVLAPYISLGKRFPNGTYATNEQFLAQNADVAERFARAINKSSQYATDHPDEARAIIPEFTQIEPAVAEKIRLPLWPTEIDRAQLEDLVGYTEKYGVIDETVPVDEMVWEGAQAE